MGMLEEAAVVVVIVAVLVRLEVRRVVFVRGSLLGRAACCGTRCRSREAGLGVDVVVDGCRAGRTASLVVEPERCYGFPVVSVARKLPLAWCPCNWSKRVCRTIRPLGI